MTRLQPKLTIILTLTLLFFQAAHANEKNKQLIDSINFTPLPKTNTHFVSNQPTGNPVDASTHKIVETIKQKFKASQRPQTPKTSQAIVKVKPNDKGRRTNFQVHKRNNGTVRQIKGNMLEPASKSIIAKSSKERDSVTARNFLRKNQRYLGIHNPDEELYLVKQKSDELGKKHLTFHQRLNGISVWPADIKVHLSAEGNVDLMNGSYAPTPKKTLNQKPRINDSEAKRLAKTALGPVKSEVVDAPELIYYFDQKIHKLAWKFRLKVDYKHRWLVIIDAVSGDVLLQYNEVMESAARGTSFDLLNQRQNIDLFEDNGLFFMVDTSKEMFNADSIPPNPNTTEGAIIVFDAQNQDINSGPFSVSLVNSNFANSGFLSDAVSAAVNISEVYDYYLEKHNRNSIDGNGSSLFGIVRVGQNFANAFWDGERMFFGDGDLFAAALDVVAHEVSHGVIQHTANLIYQGESGALNEAFADIFGEMVEARSIGQDWRLGTVLPTEFQRSLEDPSSILISGTNIPYPEKMSEFIFTQSDNGGVHLNSSIINHAYYLLAEGLDNAIGIADAEQIFYRALTQHLVRNSQFIDARLAVITAAEELFGADSSQVERTKQAFNEVEIFDNQPTTQPPVSIAEVNGEDATLFICFDPSLGIVRLCRRDTGLNDPVQGVFLSQFDVRFSRPSVSGDGSIAAFVDSINDTCFINTQSNTGEECSGLPGTVSSVAISPDGNLFGFVALDSLGQPANSITVSGLNDNTFQTQSFELVAPAIDASTINNIAFADVMNFTADGRFIIYDALTEFNLLDGTQVNNWGIYALEIATGQTSVLVTASAGVDISNPSLSKTSDNFMTFALSEESDTTSTIVAANLNTGQVEQIAIADGLFSVPGYNGDDSAIVFDVTDNSTPTGFSLFQQTVTSDRITATGTAQQSLSDAAFGVIYRRGNFVGVVEESGFYDTETQILRIHAVDVPESNGQTSTFQADLKLTGFNPFEFKLLSAVQTDVELSTGNATYNPASGIATLPRITLTDDNSNSQTFSVDMLLTSPQFDFEITRLDLIQ